MAANFILSTFSQKAREAAREGCLRINWPGWSPLEPHLKEIRGDGLPVTGMTTQLGMERGFSGWKSGEQLEGCLVAMQISWYSLMDTQSLWYTKPIE